MAADDDKKTQADAPKDHKPAKVEDGLVHASTDPKYVQQKDRVKK